MSNNNDASVTEKVTGTGAEVAGKATQAGGTAVEVGGRATQATGATVEAAGKATEVAGKGMQVAGKGVEAAGKGVETAGHGIDAGGQALMNAGNGLSSTGLGAIAGVPMTAVGALASGAGKGAQVAGKGTQAAGKGMETAGKGIERGGHAMNNTGKQIRKTGNNIVKQGKEIKKEGKEISDTGKDIKEGNSPLSNSEDGIDLLKKQKKKLIIWGLISGSGCGLFGLIIIVMIAAIFAVVSSVAEALSPITDFFSSLGHWFAGDGWCPNEVECAKEAESNFYEKVNDLYDSYAKDEGVLLDTEVLTAAALYNRFDNFNGITDTTNADPDKDETAETDEEKKDAYKEGKDRLDDLAEHLVSGDKLDYSKFKLYLVDTYIPKYYESLYNYYGSNEQTYIKNFHANAIISFSKNPTAYDALANSSLNGKYCSAVRINDSEGEEVANMKLEEYVNAVVQHYGSNFNAEVQKSLAITVRTYVIDITDYCDYALIKGGNAFDYDENVNDSIKTNLEEVSDLVMYYEDDTFEAAFDTFTGKCESGKCTSYSYTKFPSKETHTFEIDTSKVSVPNDKITGNTSSSGLSLYGAQSLAIANKGYEEILKTFFPSDIEIKKLLVFDSDFLGSSGIYRDLLYPVGWPTLSGSCQSAGEYYPGGSYHGSQDLACGSMGYYGKCTEIPIIAAHDAVVTYVIKNQQCNQYSQQAADAGGYTYDPNCGGNGIITRITDPTSDAFGYTERYWHFDSIPADIVVGTEIHTGQFLGYMGSTGNSSGYHLHYNLQDTTGHNVIMDSQFVSYCSSHKKTGE